MQYLLRLCELELIERERRMIERRIKAAKFPATKSLDSFDFKVITSLNKALTMQLARCEFVDHRQNVIALGPSGTGKTHVALGLGLAACQKGLKVRFTTAAALVHELIEAVDERRLQRLQKQLVSQDLLIIDELGFVPLSKTGAELLFEIISQRYERGSIIITSNLPFDEWTGQLSAHCSLEWVVGRVGNNAFADPCNTAARNHPSKADAFIVAQTEGAVPARAVGGWGSVRNDFPGRYGVLGPCRTSPQVRRKTPQGDGEWRKPLSRQTASADSAGFEATPWRTQCEQRRRMTRSARCLVSVLNLLAEFSHSLGHFWPRH